MIDINDVPAYSHEELEALGEGVLEDLPNLFLIRASQLIPHAQPQDLATIAQALYTALSVGIFKLPDTKARNNKG